MRSYEELGYFPIAQPEVLSPEMFSSVRGVTSAVPKIAEIYPHKHTIILLQKCRIMQPRNKEQQQNRTKLGRNYSILVKAYPYSVTHHN